jgi:hypothetical protein
MALGIPKLLHNLLLLCSSFGSSSPTTAAFGSAQHPARMTRLAAKIINNSNKNALKPAAIPLMDSGKAFARSGEFLIDLTTAEGLYGGALSAAGAHIRNAGDSIAQAAASCRFKTGVEVVVDELREAGTCLKEATDKLTLAEQEARNDNRAELAMRIGTYRTTAKWFLQ